MTQLRLALAQVNATVGDLTANAALVREHAASAAAAGADLVAFPEMVLTGYPVEDLSLRTSFVEASRTAVQQLARDLAADGLGELPVVVGYLDRVTDPETQLDAEAAARAGSGRDERGVVGMPKGLPQNCAAVLHRGQVVARYAKHHLPNYGVFDEFRFFVPGRDLLVARIGGVDVAVVICEDLWQDGGPVERAREAGAELLLVLNGSPWERDKDDTRLALAQRRAAEAGCPLAFLNLVGGQDDLVFDGDSLVVAADGELLARGAQFAEDLLVLDLDLPQNGLDPQALPAGVQHVVVRDRPASPGSKRPAVAVVERERLDPVGEVWAALQLGLGDYVRKNGFRKVALGLSGGIDSALVAAIAVDALGPEAVTGISLPSSYSSEHSRTDADDLAERTGLDYRTIPIAPMVDAFTAGLSDAMKLSPVAEENLQARVRGTTLMALSNSEGHLVLATSNKSELSVGYSTLYGDSVGGYAPLKDVPKMLVWELARWRNAQAEARGEVPPIPENSISKVPSAELRPGQTDQDSLPPYEVLDDMLEHYVVGAQGRSELLAAGFEAEVVDEVVGLVDRAEWKRRQFAPGVKISSVAFGRDRRLPITTHWREQQSR
ncbi:NAD+ synthase (glutamine-hydrolysing) [Quadrisphaera granulorum]|uniref:Glutamine-dependent NAD(+) synthetase n=1 Tax=Quadrisphaera granulorum TaxID=317664 RepID=A0A316A7C2_9ACTN|nr:NAD+ synthase [Quadrisphaera granulorum]PWJ53836.1 NAD+ synthase (glutamine-hydrolysing) [Quadrisphaera granulorum]SZE96593.1 NAD+ synthase (glutamine-hydrolysing) [Quadrisphaera granulorum]